MIVKGVLVFVMAFALSEILCRPIKSKKLFVWGVNVLFVAAATLVANEFFGIPIVGLRGGVEPEAFIEDSSLISTIGLIIGAVLVGLSFFMGEWSKTEDDSGDGE